MTASALAQSSAPRTSWTPERRRLAAARIRTHKPWLKTTGPKTAAGKSVSRMNAFKHGQRSVAAIEKRRAVLCFLREQAQFLRHVRLLLRLQRQIKKFKNPTNEMIDMPSPDTVIPQLRPLDDSGKRFKFAFSASIRPDINLYRCSAKQNKRMCHDQSTYRR